MNDLFCLSEHEKVIISSADEALRCARQYILPLYDRLGDSYSNVSELLVLFDGNRIDVLFLKLCSLVCLYDENTCFPCSEFRSLVCEKDEEEYTVCVEFSNQVIELGLGEMVCLFLNRMIHNLEDRDNSWKGLNNCFIEN